MPQKVAGLATSACVAALVVGAAARAQTAHGGPTLAVEDTMRASVSEVLVRAPRVTLDEILDRVARGEARRESLLADQSFVASFRALRRESSGELRPIREVVTKVWKKRPDRVRSVTVRDWRPRPKKGGADVRSDFSASMGEQIVNFAFRPEGRRDYRFRIEGRDLVGDHLVYRIAFEPRSVLDAENPSGLVWVNTNEFVIVRQEIRWTRSPIPLLLKRLPRMVIERGQVNGHWVLQRMLARVEMTVPLPEWGRTFDMAWNMTDYTINTGLPDSLFHARPGRRTASEERR